MSEILNVINSIKGECECGVYHETAIKDIRIGSGLVHKVGEILRENRFPKSILLVADKNTLKAAEGIVESLEGFELSFHVYDFIRVATMEHVEELEALYQGQGYRCSFCRIGLGQRPLQTRRGKTG